MRQTWGMRHGEQVVEVIEDALDQPRIADSEVCCLLTSMAGY